MNLKNRGIFKVENKLEIIIIISNIHLYKYFYYIYIESDFKYYPSLQRKILVQLESGTMDIEKGYWKGRGILFVMKTT